MERHRAVLLGGGVQAQHQLQCAGRVGGFDAPNDENRGDVHYWDVWHGDKPFTEYRKFFFHFHDPHLTAALDGDTITVTADAYARGVELETDADCVLSDNYFDMNAGQRQIKVLEGKPDSVKVRSVFDIR